jgi:hypothetical protein
MKIRQTAGWIILVLITAGTTWGGYPDENSKAVRLDLLMDEHTFKESEVGGELGFGVAMFQIDQLGLFANYKGYNGLEFKSLGLFVEENYLVSYSIHPFLGTGVGYAWADPNEDNGTEKSVYFRFQGGLKMPVIKNRAALALTLMYSVSPNDIFLDKNKLEDSKIEVNLGMRFYY